jgi:tetratricopeptide (TPR) repeat protein
MNLISAKCPNCGGELQLPENRTSVSCIYCDTKIIVSEAIKQKDKDIEPLLKLMQDSFDARGNGDELINYSNKVLEIDSNNALAMFYKGIAYYWQFKFKEGFVYIEKAIQLDSSIDFKTKIYDIIINWSKRAFDTIYYRWNISPGNEKTHCNTFFNRAGYDKNLLQELDRTYALNTKEVIKLVEFAIKLFPEKVDGHFAILRKLNEFSSNNYSWSSVISRHELRLKEMGKQLPNNSKKKSGCFIATAAMGDYDHPIVVDLRLFRDNWLLKRKWGVSFTSWYYTHGPKAAKIIEKSFLIKKITFFLIVKPLHIITIRRIKKE